MGLESLQRKKWTILRSRKTSALQNSIFLRSEDIHSNSKERDSVFFHSTFAELHSPKSLLCLSICFLCRFFFSFIVQSAYVTAISKRARALYLSQSNLAIQNLPQETHTTYKVHPYIIIHPPKQPTKMSLPKKTLLNLMTASLFTGITTALPTNQQASNNTSSPSTSLSASSSTLSSIPS